MCGVRAVHLVCHARIANALGRCVGATVMTGGRAVCGQVARVSSIAFVALSTGGVGQGSGSCPLGVEPSALCRLRFVALLDEFAAICPAHRRALATRRSARRCLARSGKRSRAVWLAPDVCAILHRSARCCVSASH